MGPPSPPAFGDTPGALSNLGEVTSDIGGFNLGKAIMGLIAAGLGIGTSPAIGIPLGLIGLAVNSARGQGQPPGNVADMGLPTGGNPGIVPGWAGEAAGNMMGQTAPVSQAATPPVTAGPTSPVEALAQQFYGMKRVNMPWMSWPSSKPKTYGMKRT